MGLTGLNPTKGHEVVRSGRQHAWEGDQPTHQVRDHRCTCHCHTHHLLMRQSRGSFLPHPQPGACMLTTTRGADAACDLWCKSNAIRVLNKIRSDRATVVCKLGLARSLLLADVRLWYFTPMCSDLTRPWKQTIAPSRVCSCGKPGSASLRYQSQPG